MFAADSEIPSSLEYCFVPRWNVSERVTSNVFLAYIFVHNPLPPTPITNAAFVSSR